MTRAGPDTGNLPRELTSFVGRRAELADARRMLGEAPLLTLTGIGGVGKTRLALRLANELRRTFHDGAWLVELATTEDHALVAQSIAAQLGLRDDSGRWSVQALTDHLRQRQTLLVIDNCEHLIDAVAVVAEALLRGAPELRIVATSRQPIGIAGERVLVVPALQLPDEAAAASNPQIVRQVDAVSLFVERARSNAPDFEVTDSNAVDVAQLVRRLDGIPLALELAAARMRMLSPGQLLTRLDAGFGVLASTGRANLPHQRSIATLIDWSYRLCTPAEQALWAALSVFPADFDLDAAEYVCTDGDPALVDVLGSIAGLIDKSVLAPEDGGAQIRYRMLQSVCEFGAARLDASRVRELRARHRDYFQRRSALAWAEWFGPRQVEHTAWMMREHVNLRSALKFDLDSPGPADVSVGLAPTMALYWVVSGSLTEGRAVLSGILRTQTEPSASRGIVAGLAAWLALRQGDAGAVEEIAEESLRLTEQFAEPMAHAHSLIVLARAKRSRDDAAAAELFRRALEGAAGSEPIIRMRALRGLGEIAVDAGDLVAAERLLDECVQLCDASGESWERGWTLGDRALIRLHSGDAEAALADVRENVRLCSLFPDQVGVAQALGICAVAEPDPERAATLAGAADAAWNRLGASAPAALAGLLTQRRDQLKAALGVRAYGKAVEAGHGLDFRGAVGFALGEPTVVAARVRGVVPVLTKREREVATLVADGMSNREIAAGMTISQRTVEGHVENILAKLGFTSRAQIAAWVAARGLDG